MKRVHELEVKAFSRQTNSQRYNYFVEKVFAWQEAWALCDNEGWVIAEVANKMIFPLWPAEPFAKNCQINDWRDTTPKLIAFAELITELLPDLVENNIDIAVFMVPDSTQCGVLPAQQLLNDFLTLSKSQKR